MPRRLRRPDAKPSGWYQHPLRLAVFSAFFGALLGAILTPTVPAVWEAFVHRNDSPPPSEAELSLSREQAAVTAIRPGGLASDLPSALGEPVSETTTVGRYTRWIYVLDHSAVLAVSDESDRVLALAVMSFDPAFTPTFNLPDGGSATLWRTTVAEVGSYSGLAVGNLGNHDAFYFEWGGGPVGATNYQQGYVGHYALSDVEDPYFATFMVFLNVGGMGLPYDPSDIPDETSGWLERWTDSETAKRFRDELVVNVVGFQAVAVDVLPVFPSPLWTEVWPHRV